MDQLPLPLPSPPANTAYDIAVLQVKIMCLAALVEDLQKTVSTQADQIQQVEDWIRWNKK